jgi:hypothetical protein
MAHATGPHHGSHQSKTQYAKWIAGVGFLPW